MLAPEFPPVRGGVGTYIVELIQNLPSDIEVHVVTLKRNGFSKKETCLINDFSGFYKKNIHIHTICTASDTFIYNLKFQYACLRHVPKIIKEENLDLIHSHAAHMPDLMLKTLKNQLPIITTVHTTIRGQREGTHASMLPFQDLENSEKMTFLTYPFLYLIDNIYFSTGNYYITPSNWMKDCLLKTHPNLKDNIFVVPHGIDTDFFTPPPKKQRNSKNVILFVGRLIALKGIFYLIQAFPLVLKEYPNTVIFFVGPGEKKPYIDELRRCGVPRELFIPWLS